MLGLCARTRRSLQQLAGDLGASATCAVYAGDVRDASAASRRGSRFYGALRDARRRRGQRRGVGRHVDCPRRRQRRRFAPCSTPTCSAWCIRFSRSCPRCRRRATASWSALPAWRAFVGCRVRAPIRASKAAAISYLESLRVELGGSGVEVHHALSGIRRYADDREKSVSDALSACPLTRRHG